MTRRGSCGTAALPACGMGFGISRGRVVPSPVHVLPCLEAARPACAPGGETDGVCLGDAALVVRGRGEGWPLGSTRPRLRFKRWWAAGQGASLRRSHRRLKRSPRRRGDYGSEGRGESGRGPDLPLVAFGWVAQTYALFQDVAYGHDCLGPLAFCVSRSGQLVADLDRPVGEAMRHGAGPVRTVTQSVAFCRALGR